MAANYDTSPVFSKALNKPNRRNWLVLAECNDFNIQLWVNRKDIPGGFKIRKEKSSLPLLYKRRELKKTS
ncbi:MAG: hypothetical protein ACREOP_12115 [Thermodesulfobacteriota bacterium]